MAKKAVLAVIVAAVVLFTWTALAQRTQIEIAPKYPSLNNNRYQRSDPWAPGSWMNPYQVRDKSTGQTWEVRPKYPDFGDRTGTFAPGSFLNPWTVEEK